ncbi:hypothetical protein PTKIN_Ptkin13bG0294100 [Pterospermum kingtungense]
MAPDASTAVAVRQKVQKFLHAASTGNLDLLKYIAAQLDEGKGLEQTVADIKDANKRGAIHFAAREGKTEVCKYLLEEFKLDVDTKDEDGETPLLYAAGRGHTPTAKYLIEHGANLAIVGDCGATALHYSAETGNIELLKYILAKGVEVDAQGVAGTPLIWAAGHAQPDAVKVLLEHDANPNAKTENNTPLLASVRAGSLECLDLLIKGGAEVNITAGGVTPLYIAADNANPKLINFLLKAGAEPNAETEYGTPLSAAVEADSLECLDLLIEAGAKVNMKAGGTTPLHIAALDGSPELINCLLKAGADPNVTDVDGRKPMQVAADRGQLLAVTMLFPLTSKIDAIPVWTMDGILEYMQSDAYVPPEAKKKAAEAKSRGDEAFKRKEFHMAIDAYTQAIAFDPTDATLRSNRSLCWIRLGQPEHALTDAKACRAFRPDWPKACYREGVALRLLQKYDEAADAFYKGVKLDPENKELENAYREAVEAGRKFHGTDKEKS